ncbi:hypothetical protein M2347_001336 [Chryseobacterium sp. H1D6B]|uniref:hypothetical protein n=1 Tax=Chryseobacterium sp. H1D6B TaxID=2940588 RepID=UPI0015CC63A1|nr:hypothetical protein [Chryseobacterium sp. H1D6B]MDH6251609.1 hypothetical protein [Chryseobacterium sp. H1D6B]
MKKLFNLSFKVLFLSFVFIGSVSLVEGQTKKWDTLRYEEKRPDCTEFHEKEKKYYDELLEDSKTIDYSGLDDLIIKNINKRNLKTEDLKLYIRKIQTICGNEIEYSVCYSNVNTRDPLYNENNFWSETSIKKINERLNKNLIFVIRYFGFGNSENFIDKINFRYVSKELKNFIVKQKNEKYNGRDFYYVPSLNNNKIDIEKADYLNLQFHNYLDKIVVVKYNINNEDEYKTFQYNNRKWKEISTKDEFKF